LFFSSIYDNDIGLDKHRVFIEGIQIINKEKSRRDLLLIAIDEIYGKSGHNNKNPEGV
jgi:hypothetical protein